MPTIRKPRTPAKKFVTRKYSIARLRRIQETIPKEWFSTVFPKIFSAAENLLQIQRPKDSTLLFLGQGMLPLFEATRAINEIEMRSPRRQIKYFVVPRRIELTSWQKAIGTFRIKAVPKETRIRIISNFLLANRLVSGKPQTFFVVDAVTSQKGSYGTVSEAIKRLNPNATVVSIDQFSEIAGKGISNSDIMEKPTTKDSQGRVKAKENKSDANEILAFQKALQDYITARKKK